MINILYIGNDLYAKSNYFSAMEKLFQDLKSEGYNLIKTSSQQNFILRLLDMVISLFRFRKWADIILIDVFSTKGFYYALVISQLCRVFKLKYITILHGGNLPYRLDKSPKLCKLVFKNSWYNISPSKYLNHEFSLRGFSSVVIPNSIVIEDIPFTERKFIEPKLLYVRAFARIYNPQMAIEVFKRIKEEFPASKLCMIGPEKDDSLSEVQKLIGLYDLSDSVEITGTLSREVWFEKSKDYDIFINTTNIDNMPVSLIEAMALGLTIVSTKVGGIPYLVDHGINGVLVEQDNSKEMAIKIAEIIKENNLHLSINARKQVETLQWSYIRHDWIKILNQC